MTMEENENLLFITNNCQPNKNQNVDYKNIAYLLFSIYINYVT